ncbi:MAG: 2,3-bisphosphoglycerate-independent phosphoglycerate mutase [Gracilimonas sp.]|uniref:2,3-bisphosphoglycerate-independent phosphoglycerate mutase n=1 Tax=Gracilimonas TaxID=649462 RepID=UPI001B293352|nr:2,3-bisphosphoglycerate-independent phosphoglycerate mutase [Gracilimonas sp.]MBO6585881.1 2,3-bisphosphoglycerate-independent phosphoglycerate mutase [Gracilimonas sp.]MBO6616878.1 2,3-bisphosphoglycerate-independent phosphoglycerate mutase [Gracilimonas sp.]
MANAESKALLVILDGFGLAENPEVSAVDKADTPFIDSLFQNYPHAKLSASGENVGLPDGQFGNSEVGHLNIGAGRIVWQELSRINKAIQDGSFFENEKLLAAVEKAKSRNKIHIMGLFSDGGVHSHNEHLFALLELCKKHGIENVNVHAFTDGRDTSPNGGIEYAKEFEAKAQEVGVGQLSSIVGRYYAMDRDNRWERIKLAYDLLVHGEGEKFESASKGFKASYEAKVTDEFIKPILLDDSPESRIQKGDVVIFYNIRGDRARQISRALNEDGFSEFEVEDLDLHYTTFTSYDETFEFARVAYPPQELSNTMGEWISNQGLRQFRIAETEKYPHVTYFFNGGVETPNKGEERIVIPSPKVATYDLQPEMSAEQVADTLCKQLSTEKHHFVVLNFANPDMVGHTGVMEAAIEAVETVDKQLERVIETANKHGYRTLIIADHGNADCMIKEDGSPHTAHTTALVPAIVVNYPEEISLSDGILADVSPTLLKLMGIEQPKEMTGKSLF